MSKMFPTYKRRFIVAFLFVTLLLLLFNESFLKNTRDNTIRIFTTPSDVCGNVAGYFVSKRDLADENRVLRKETGDLLLEVSRMEDIEQENFRLRELLAFKKKFKFKTISAEVIAREPNNWTGSFIIDRGEKDGLSSNAAVCSSKGLVGKVASVGADRATVILLTHPNFKAGGVISGSRTNGVVAGIGNNTVSMVYIPMDAVVEKGSIVTTSGFGRIFPKGIRIGEIKDVKKSRTGLYQCAEIKPFAGLSDEEEVLCIVEGGQ